MLDNLGLLTDQTKQITEPDPKLYLPSSSLVEIQADGSIHCTQCGHHMQTKRKKHQGNLNLVKKGKLAGQHFLILSWWLSSNHFRDMSLLKSELHDEYNKIQTNKPITFNPFQGRLSEMVGAGLVIEGLQSPPLYRLNIEYARKVIANEGRLKFV